MQRLRSETADASDVLIAVPARMAASRLHGKPLADINGQPMIVRVARRAKRARIGDVVVAAADAEIVAAVEAAGERAVLVADDVPSGSDRVAAAAQALDPEGRFRIVVNLQGDAPETDPEAIRLAVNALRRRADADLATLASPLDDDARRTPSVVKARANFADESDLAPIAEDFFRRDDETIDPAQLRRHVGIYAYRREALARFASLPPSERERRLALEQLRALDHGMRIAVARVAQDAGGVDTPDDLRRARRRIARAES